MENIKKNLADEALRKSHILKIKSTRKVFNKKNTTGLRCNCNSWLAHWKLYSNKDVALCVVQKCCKTATVGAHVVSSQSSKKVYIAPFCNMHNNVHNTKCMTLDHNFPLVNADKGKLCCKQNVATRAIIKKSPYFNERLKKRR